jgi:hypothetical protein
MLSKTYEALRAAGVPEDKARAAAEDLTAGKTRLASIDNHLAKSMVVLPVSKANWPVSRANLQSCYGDRGQRRCNNHYARQALVTAMTR